MSRPLRHNGAVNNAAFRGLANELPKFDNAAVAHSGSLMKIGVGNSRFLHSVVLSQIHASAGYRNSKAKTFVFEVAEVSPKSALTAEVFQ